MPDNLDAYMKRVVEERDELLEEVRRLREERTADNSRDASCSSPS